MTFPSKTSAYGMWSLNDVASAKRSNTWPGVALYKHLFAFEATPAIKTYSIQDYDNPTEVGSFPTASYFTSANAIHVDPINDVLYVAAGTALVALDVSDPENISYLGSLAISAYNCIINSTGTVVFACSTSDTVYSVDVTDPTNMSVLNSYTDSTRLDSPRSLAITNDDQYLDLPCYSDNAVTRFDVSDPSNITYLDENAYGSPNIDGPFGCVHNSDDSALIVTDVNGIFTLDTSGLDASQTNAAQLDQYGSGNLVQLSVKSGYDDLSDTFYISRNTNFYALGMTDPSNIQELSVISITTTGNGVDCAVAPVIDRVYVGTSNNINTIDVSDKANATVVGTFGSTAHTRLALR